MTGALALFDHMIGYMIETQSCGAKRFFLFWCGFSGFHEPIKWLPMIVATGRRVKHATWYSAARGTPSRVQDRLDWWSSPSCASKFKRS